MTDAIAHRGPDDHGYLLLDSRDGAFQLGQEGLDLNAADVCFGSRRLAIIDLSARARQPMANIAGDLFLVFNGEIFNYKELRAELCAQGRAFRTESDTEVILHAYEHWGRDCVTHFNGMWAFAIWDQRKRSLFCSRDRFGIKPFYYRLDERSFVFASEIKGILAALKERPRANEGVLGDYLLDGSVCRAPETFFEGVQRLPAAHNLIVSADRSESARYWDYPFDAEPIDGAQGKEQFRELFLDAVNLRLRGDVPVGVALSGGVDSSAVLGVAAKRYQGRRIKAFTAVFPGESYDERRFAELAARRAGAEFFAVDYRPSNFVSDLREVIWDLDYPALQAQILPRSKITDLAAQHVKVILEGQGSDEMLAGYVNRYFVPYAMDELLRVASGRNQLAMRELISGAVETYWNQPSRLAGALLRTMAPDSSIMRTLRTRRESEMVYDRGFLERRNKRGHPVWKRRFGTRLSDALHRDHSTAILPMLLKFGDAISMGSSIESRLPFLDYRLVELTFRLEAQSLLRGTRPKQALKAAMKGIVPEQILNRRDKVGFSTPLSRWISKTMTTEVRPLLLSRCCRGRGVFDPVKLEKALDRHTEGDDLLSVQLFRWVSLEVWFRMFIDGEGRAGT